MGESAKDKCPRCKGSGDMFAMGERIDCIKCHGDGVYAKPGGSVSPVSVSITPEVFDSAVDRLLSHTHRMETDEDGMITVSEIGDDAQREQERIRLVDGYPGDWEWTGERWEMTVYYEHATFVEAVVEPSADGYWSCLRLESPTTGGELDVIESAARSDDLMEAAAAIRPHAEAMVKVLEGMSDG